MTYLVHVGFVTGANVDSQYLRLDDPVSGLLDTGILAPDGLTTDLSVDSNGQQRVMAFSVDRSSTQAAGQLVEYAAGTLSLTLRDDQGDLDPANISEPIPGVSITLAKVWAGTVYPLFTGTIDSWLPDLVGPAQAIVQVTASDALAAVGGYSSGDTVDVGPGDTTGARVARVLNAIGWPAGRRHLDTGLATLAAASIGGDAIEVLRTVARAEVGDLWATADGKIRFRDRNDLYTATVSSTVQATFGSDRAGGELPYGSLGMSYDQTVINVVRASRAGGTVYESSDDVSRARYGDKAVEQTELLLADDTQVAAWADFVRARDGIPRMRFTQVVLDVRADEDTFYPKVLTREFGDRVAVVRRPPGVAADSRPVWVRGIHHAFTAPTQLLTTFEVEEAPVGPAFILDDPVNGLLDANVLIY